MFPDFIHAAIWGFIGTFSLIIGGFLGNYLNIPKKILASLIIFSAGILSSAVCFEILLEAFTHGGIIPTIIGFVIGIVIFTFFDIFIHKTNIKSQNQNTKINSNSSIKNIYQLRFHKYYNKYQTESITIIFGVLLDGIPEAIAIGLLLFIGGPISYALIISIFIVNLIEGLYGASNMKLAKWKTRSILSVWVIVTLAATLVATLSFIIFSNTDVHILAIALGISAGALISIIADVTLPEAFNETHELTGLLMGLGFLLSFILSHIITH